MASDALVVRIEGAYEQIDRRLGSIDNRIASLEHTVNERTDRVEQRIDRVEQKLDATFRWVIGIVLVNWITLMLAVLLRR
jgi:tetrahydromethanopterin S-methyltransferase subunit G